MPKQKTHGGTKDRVKITKRGKVLRGNTGKNHLLQKKSASRKRRLDVMSTIDGKSATNAKRKLGRK